jgi:hypothetical protein
MQFRDMRTMQKAPAPLRSRAKVRTMTIERTAQAEVRRIAALAAAAEYDTARRAIAAKTERLKALRLARDAAPVQQPPAKPKPPRPSR